MIDDEQLRDVLRREAESHQPDLVGLRARFEAGRAATPAAVGTDQCGGGSGRARPRLSRLTLLLGSPGRRGAPILRSAILVAAVVCAVSVMVHRAQPQTGPTATVPSPPGPAYCASGDDEVLGRYWLLNNLWGADKGTGHQCVRSLSHQGSRIGWSTDWDWSGGPGQVKSFASVVLGWEWGWKVPGTGLPVAVSDLRTVRTNWNFTLTQKTPNDLDVAYDLWFHNVPHPTDENPSAEVRVLLYHTGGEAVPPASKVGTVTIDGASWDLYRTGSSWDVFSFVRSSPTTSAELDLKDFIDKARSIGVPGSFDYLSSVQAGADVRTGSGRLTTTDYSVRID
jgi:xyloglucan-specific endo-beta-1,4-glucanase